MGQQLWIPDLLRDYGCQVHEVDGWETRGLRYLDGPNKGKLEPFDPEGVVGHHTAGPTDRPVPSLNVCTNGRPDLRGPLCQVLIGREPKCYVIAAGRANHAGSGGWKGLTGNGSVLGIEVENNGVDEDWTDEVYREFVLCSAALLDGIDAPTDHWCGHREWTPRKPDPRGIDLNQMRADIEHARRNKRGGTAVSDPFVSALQAAINSWLPPERRAPTHGRADQATLDALRGLLTELGNEAHHQRKAMEMVNSWLPPEDNVPVDGRRWGGIDTTALKKALDNTGALIDRHEAETLEARRTATETAVELAATTRELDDMRAANVSLSDQLNEALVKLEQAGSGECDPDTVASAAAWWKLVDSIRLLNDSIAQP